MRNIILTGLVAVSSLIGCTSEPTSKKPETYTIEQFMDTPHYGGASFSSDNERILFTGNQSGIFNAYSIGIEGGEATPLTTSDADAIQSLAYFPHDNRFLFTSNQRGNELSHIFVQNMDGTVQDLTPGDSSRADFGHISHDNKSFYFAWNKRDSKYMDLYEVDFETLTPKLIFENDAGWNVGKVSPDRHYLALMKMKTMDDTDMFLYDFRDESLKNITRHKGREKNLPVTFTPDSRELYYLTDEDSEFLHLKSYVLATGESKALGKFDWDIAHAFLSHSGRYLVVVVDVDGEAEVKIYDHQLGRYLQLPDLSDGVISGLRISQSEDWMAFYITSSRSPQNLYSYNIKTEELFQLTDGLNPEMDPEDLVEGKVVRYPSFDSLPIPAILYKPLQASSKAKLPAVIFTHGGPGGRFALDYDPTIQYLVNNGYVVIAVNNRGSSGYGKTFYRAADLKHGDVDLADVIEAKKYLASTGYVDPKRIGILGGSYGGYLVLAALTFHPEVFDVGVDIFGVANWPRTLTSTPPWWESQRLALFAKIGDPDTQGEYLRSISPLFYADRIKRPLMVLQGANDPRVLKVESDEMVEAVKKKGVPVEYIVFPDEGHGFLKKENKITAWKQVLQFLNKHLKGG